MTGTDRRRDEHALLADALRTFDEGSRLLEQAYRELWTARESERGAREVDASERVRDLCHAVRNPLGGVRGLASLLERELAGIPGAERGRRLLAKMVDGLDAAEATLQAHGEAGDDRADAGAVAEEVCALALAERRAAGSDVDFAIRAPRGLELPLPTVRFREILSNLVRNSAEACGDAGTVTVTVVSDLEAVSVLVTDDGPGLPDVPDDVLFRRGWSTRGPDRGRGLALAAELAETAGGSLTLGRLARGTVARIRLPRS